jgi:hypothetical protein
MKILHLIIEYASTFSFKKPDHLVGTQHHRQLARLPRIRDPFRGLAVAERHAIEEPQQRTDHPNCRQPDLTIVVAQRSDGGAGAAAFKARGREPSDGWALARVVAERLRGEPILAGVLGQVHAAGRHRTPAGFAARALFGRCRRTAHRPAALAWSDHRRRPGDLGITSHLGITSYTLSSDPGRATASRVAMPHMLPSTILNASTPRPLRCRQFRGSIHTLPDCCVRFAAAVTSRLAQHSLPSARHGLLGPDSHRLERASFAWRTSDFIPHVVPPSSRAATTV